MEYLLFIATDTDPEPEGTGGTTIEEWVAEGERRGHSQAGRSAAAARGRDDRAGAQGRAARRRRTVHRVQGVDRRATTSSSAPTSTRRSTTSRGIRWRDPDGSRSGRFSRGRADGRHRGDRGRPPVRLGPHRRRTDPAYRRLDARRGRHPGCVRDRPRALAARRHPGPTGGMADDHGAQPGDRQAALDESRTIDAAGAEHRTRADGDRGHRRRPAAPDLHVLPSGPAARHPRGADPAHGRRSPGRRDRAGVPRARRPRWRSGWCGRAARSITPASRTGFHRPSCWRNG